MTAKSASAVAPPIGRLLGIIGGVFGVFFLGMICGVAMMRGEPPPPSRYASELWEISPNARREEVDQMFADFKAGRIAYTMQLAMFGVRMNVRVVNNQTMNADFGFVPLSELEETPPTHLWYFRAGEFEVKKYDQDHLFVSIRDRYRHALKNGNKRLPPERK